MGKPLNGAGEAAIVGLGSRYLSSIFLYFWNKITLNYKGEIKFLIQLKNGRNNP
jgi:hypothetical protein